METKLYFKRKIKGLALKYKIHNILGPFEGILLNTAYLSRFSRWRDSHNSAPYNDFYNINFDGRKRFDIYQYLIDNCGCTEKINYIEFGVATGRTFRWWTEHNLHPHTRFIGFDTFTGLPEDWDLFKKGEMTAGGEFPDIQDDRVSFKKGLFQDTLPQFLKEFDFKNIRNIIHLDADLYSSTLYAMTMIYPYLNDGDIFIFDEFGVPTHEFKAFMDFADSFYIKYEPIAAVNNYLQFAVRIFK